MKKYATFLLLFATSLLAFQCAKEKIEPAYQGQVLRMECFDRWGIKTHAPGNTDSLIYVIPDHLPSEYEKADLQIRFNVTLRANTLPPLFPDPSVSPGSIFQGEVTDLIEIKG